MLKRSRVVSILTAGLLGLSAAVFAADDMGSPKAPSVPPAASTQAPPAKAPAKAPAAKAKKKAHKHKHQAKKKSEGMTAPTGIK